MGYNTTMAEDDAWEDGIVEPNDGQAGWSFSRQSSSRRKEPLEFDWEEERRRKAELTDPKLDYRTRYNQWHDKLVKHSMYVSPTEEAEEGDMAGFLEANKRWEAKRKHYDWSDGYGRDTGSRKYKQPSKVWAEDHDDWRRWYSKWYNKAMEDEDGRERTVHRMNGAGGIEEFGHSGKESYGGRSQVGFNGYNIDSRPYGYEVYKDWKRHVLKWPQDADGVVGLWPVASKKVSSKPGGGQERF
ncbi:hypothetical protein GUITHDRAFT_121973 [Guillardia theta CCMP2712]|uniref:Uncharacterized protein n=1 Tax=Guillardia theta (strain CCMP2712) TaxID=905079 RepID=L1I6G0_GUITC|nr:hypothetical protein GUITHDRAFT_121973 [Guillardia theta CCMP2712]EKX31838.1 hypothetical protein GUITHDRAFT_121973 [Guillardia theta CCMP2712]|eukprot:XP_005818818.1 hypothetical protein GUITHDRAFT_121973 [Guillardia theta CCMP2712]